MMSSRSLISSHPKQNYFSLSFVKILLLLSLPLLSSSRPSHAVSQEHSHHNNICSHLAHVDSIASVNFRGVAYILTSNGFYWILKEDQIANINSLNASDLQPIGRLPFPMRVGDAAVVKDVYSCPEEKKHLEEHLVVFAELLSGSLQFASYNLSSHLANEPEPHSWVKPRQLSQDLIFGNAEIDFKKKLDAMFNTDNEGEIFFIQGSLYSSIEFSSSCPTKREEFTVHPSQPLASLNIEGNIDAAYYESDINTLFLINYENDQYYRVVLDKSKTKEGKLFSTETTKHPIYSHPWLKRICAPSGVSNATQYDQPESHIPSDGGNSGIKTATSQSYRIASQFNVLTLFMIIMITNLCLF